MKLMLLWFQFIIIFFTIFQYTTALLFPQYSVYQIVAAVSWPVELKFRKAFMNMGFQFNYMMPFNFSTLWSPTNWSGGLRSIQQDVEINSNNNTLIENNKNKKTKFKKSRKNNRKRKIKSKEKNHRQKKSINFDEENYLNYDKKDMSAGEIYKIVENNLVSFGFHETCLLKSVCQLAQHPLHIGNEEHLLAEVIQYLLTPSEHQAFTKHERYDCDRYETAELIGRNNGDCEIIYSECQGSLLDYISYVTD